MKKSTSCKTGGAKRSHRIFALLLTLTVILLTLCLASCGKSEPTAEEYLEKALEKSFSFDVQAPFTVGDSFLVDIVWNETADTEAFGIDAIDAKLYGSAVTASSALELNLEMMGSSLALKGYSDGAKYVVSTDALGDVAYGADLMKLEENFGDSIFGDPSSPYYVGDPSELALPTPSVIDTNALAERYLTAIKSAACENSTATLSDRDGGGKSLSFVFGNDGIKGLIRACYDLMKDDAELRALLETYVSSAEDGEDLLQSFDSIFASEDALNELLAEFDEGSYEATLTVLTDDRDVIETATVAFRYTDEGAADSIELSFDMSEENTCKLSVAIDTEETGQQSYALVVKEKTTGGAKSTVLSLEVVQGIGTKVSLELLNATYNETSGDFSVMLLRGIPDTDTVTLKGKMTVSEDAASVSVTKLSIGDTSMTLDLRLGISAVESIPEIPAYTDVLSLTEFQMDAIGEALMSHPLLSLLFSN